MSAETQLNSPVTLADLNAFTIDAIERRGKSTLLTGRLTLPGQPKPGDFVVLLVGPDDDVTADVQSIDPESSTATLDGPADLPPGVVVGATFPVCGHYWAAPVRIVLDPNAAWKRTHFRSPDAFVTTTPTGEMWQEAQPGDAARTDGCIRPGGWDHEHCEICWVHVDERSPDGYVSDSNDWVCGECYARYVARADLSFVNDGGGEPEVEPFAAVDRLIDRYDLAGVRAWLSAGNDPDVRSRSGSTPLMVAASRNHQALASLLLSAGADPAAVGLGPAGITPLAFAAQNGFVELTRTLLDAGAVPRLPATVCGGSLLLYVKTGRGRDKAEIAALLDRAGAT